MDILFDTLEFAARALVIVIAVGISSALVFSFARRGRRGQRPHGELEVRKLNRRFEAMGDALKARVFGKNAYKESLKERKKLQGDGKKDDEKPNVYVLDFDGDIFATATASLREEVTAILAAAKPTDEVIVRLESGGGAVSHYGLAASQLTRLKAAKLKVTCCIDRVAASGGYMMACVADEIVAAPFSIVGSIGVVAQIPNVNRLLKKHDVDFQEMTAGEFKRTLTVFGEITDKGKAKFQEQLEETHQLFKDFVKSQRPKLNVDQIATGEYWLATRGRELGLVDSLGTSDELLLQKATTANVYAVHFKPMQSLRQRLGGLASQVAEQVTVGLINRWSKLQLR